MLRAMSTAVPGFLSFVNASPSPFHAVHSASEMLLKHGFTALEEKGSWAGKILPSGRYFTTRNKTSVVAFVVGGKYEVDAGGFTVLAAHTDSPCLKVKPISKRESAGCLMVATESYGGLLAYTWFDRDLSIAGRVLVEDPATGIIRSHLVRIDEPILRVPSLAIHLQREANEKFAVNKENDLAALLATASSTLNTGSSSTTSAAAAAASSDGGAAAAAATSAAASSASAVKRHHSALLARIASDIGVEPERICDFELCLYDTQPATTGGVTGEFIFSPRLDNLLMSYACLESLVRSAADDAAVAAEANIRVVGLFDNEEVGSDSVPGAGSTFLEQVLRRVMEARDASVSTLSSSTFSRAVRRSILVSADMAHACHPSHSHLHEAAHRPKLNGGLVIKSNTNQRYATTAVTATVVRKAADAAGAPIQEFVVRQDMGCGSTIGPILSTSLGMRTVDVGVPQLAMHSCREMCGAADLDHAVAVLTRILVDFHDMEAHIVDTD